MAAMHWVKDLDPEKILAGVSGRAVLSRAFVLLSKVHRLPERVVTVMNLGLSAVAGGRHTTVRGHPLD